jgi:hypothetical protein
MNVRPWELPLLSVDQFERMIDYVEDHIIKDGG